jgi:hypothetical protein
MNSKISYLDLQIRNLQEDLASFYSSQNVSTFEKASGIQNIFCK